MTKARFIKQGRVKRLTTTGRIRRVGFRNTTDKEASRANRKRRVKGFVNNPDTFKKSRIARKNFRRGSGFGIFG